MSKKERRMLRAWLARIRRPVAGGKTQFADGTSHGFFGTSTVPTMEVVVDAAGATVQERWGMMAVGEPLPSPNADFRFELITPDFPIPPATWADDVIAPYETGGTLDGALWSTVLYSSGTVIDALPPIPPSPGPKGRLFELTTSTAPTTPVGSLWRHASGADWDEVWVFAAGYQPPDQGESLIGTAKNELYLHQVLRAAWNTWGGPNVELPVHTLAHEWA